MINKKKICLVIPSLQAGGMERVMSELATFFCSKIDYEVHIILFGLDPEIFYSLPGNLNIHVPKTIFNNKLRIIYTFGRIIFIRRKVKQINPITVLSFGELWNSFVLIALFGLTYPVYISDRCSPIRKFKMRNRLLRKLLYPRAKGIIAQTRMARDIYFSQFRHRNIKVIGNPIREIQDNNKLEKQDIVLMVGRLIKTKHQDKLIELFIKIGIPGWKLLLVGYDHLQQKNYERLIAIIKANNAEDVVFLEGKQKDVESYYRKSKIFAFTSSSEGFPNVIGEAMAAGLPVVAFDCIAGPSDIIRNDINGILIPLFDYKYFMEKLKLLMKDETLRNRIGKNAKEEIKKFSIERIGEQYLDFILDRD